MELSLKSQKSFFIKSSRWRSIVLAPFSFGILALLVFSTDLGQKIVPTPLSQGHWIPHLMPNSSFSDHFYILFFRHGSSSALHNRPADHVPARPAADGNFSMADPPSQSYPHQNASHRKGALAPNAGESSSNQSEYGARNGNVSPVAQETLYGNPVASRREELHQTLTKNATPGSIQGDAMRNTSSAPLAPGIQNTTLGNVPGASSLNKSSAPPQSFRANGSYSSDSSYSRGENSSPGAGVPSDALTPISTNADREKTQLHSSPSTSTGQCDISVGRWVEDDSPRLYELGSCQFVDQGFSCQKNGRPDANYTRWKWVPRDCEIPRLNGTRMLERLRRKRFLFVGDSLNRNQWESLVCILRESLADKTRVAEVHGGRTFKVPGAYSFKFQDYNCTLEFYTAPYLVNQVEEGSGANFTVWLDRMDKAERKWRKADVLVFNTGHWWTADKIMRGDLFREKDIVHHNLDVMVAYRKAIETWATWVDRYINASRTQVFFRGYSPSHYRGGQWNSGGQCHLETQPIFNESFISPYPSKMQVVEEIISRMRVPVHILNITRLSDFRKDAHPAVYGHRPLEVKDYQDCSHWCLPGLPDTWNELLSFSLWD